MKFLSIFCALGLGLTLASCGDANETEAKKLGFADATTMQKVQAKGWHTNAQYVADETARAKALGFSGFDELVEAETAGFHDPISFRASKSGKTTGAAPSEPVLKYVSEHIWSVWENSCDRSEPALKGTYIQDRGQVIYKNGEVLQDGNASNIKYYFLENADGSFTFNQKTYALDIPNVLVTDLTEKVSITSDGKMKIQRNNVTMTFEALRDISTDSSNPSENPENYKTEDEITYESMCS